MPTIELTEKQLRYLDELGLQPDDLTFPCHEEQDDFDVDFDSFDSIAEELNFQPDDPLFCEDHPRFKPSYSVMYKEAKKRGEDLYVVYRMEIVGTDKFYIGVTKSDLKTYWGSGKLWNAYIKKHGVKHSQIRKRVLSIISKEMGEIHTPFHLWSNQEEMAFYLEQYYIQECFEEDGDWVEGDDGEVKFKPNGKMKMKEEFIGKCLNLKYTAQNSSRFLSSGNGKDIYLDLTCPDCGAKQNHHKKSCPHYKVIPCAECGGRNGKHRKGCSHHTGHLTQCHECGGVYGHHKKHCSQHTKIRGGERCNECGCVGSYHKKTCSLYIKRKPCPECGCTYGNHKLGCSLDKRKRCPECGSRSRHKKTCSKAIGKGCSECGSIARHKKGCSLYKDPKSCSECGGLAGKHKKTCSLYKERQLCSECNSMVHETWCSKSTISKCPICSTHAGAYHKRTCTFHGTRFTKADLPYIQQYLQDHPTTITQPTQP